MVLAARAEEGCLRTEPLLQVEADHVTVEGDRPLEVGDLQVDVPDVRTWIPGGVGAAAGCYQRERRPRRLV